MGRIYKQLLPLLLLCSCMNRNEREIVGKYEVKNYVLIDSKSHYDLPKLFLNSDKSFIVEYKDREVSGNWKANDYGDFTLIYFTIDNRKWEEGRVFIDTNVIIEITEPYNEFFPLFKEINFASQ